MTMAVEDNAMSPPIEARKPVVLSSLERVQRYGIECKVRPLTNCQDVYEPRKYIGDLRNVFNSPFSFVDITRVPSEMAFAFGEANGK
jgi:hypothetical protein